MEDILLSKISELQIPTDTDTPSDNSVLNSLLVQHQDTLSLIEKLKKALDKINDAYEIGDYSREEWLSRKDQRNKELTVARNTLHELEQKLFAFQSVSQEGRISRLNHFLENIKDVTSHEERNRLYGTIIDKIIWSRDGDKIGLEIVFK